MRKSLTEFLANEDGATAIEYGLVAGLIGLAIIVGATLLGNVVDALYMSNANRLNDAVK